jgi:hypothetical protein
MPVYNKDTISIEKFHNAYVIDDQNMTVHDSRLQHISYVATHCACQLGSILEFGVYQGASINHIADLYLNENIWGFDSFEGLPEDWFLTKKAKEANKTRYKQSAFKVDKLPSVRPNVSLVAGWFDKTLPDWIDKNSNPINILHIDCDLYSSTIYVLKILNRFIIPGTIILFDELYNWKKPQNYTLWEEGEWKALVEWVNTYNREFEILSRTSFQQCAIRIIK